MMMTNSPTDTADAAPARRRAVLPRLWSVRARVLTRVPQALFLSPTGRRVLLAVAPSRFPALPARHMPISTANLPPSALAVARPLYYPQRGRGVLNLTHCPPIGGRRFIRVVRRARSAGRVVVEPTFLDSSSSGRALAVLALAGAVLDQPPRPDSDRRVPGHLRPLITDRDRELRSIRIRREGLAAAERELPRHSTSVLLASRRPRDLPSAVEQIEAQNLTDVQLIVGAHGGQFRAVDLQAARARFSGEIIITRFDDAVLFGDVLNALTERADGALVTKWDDDDWYGPDHIPDLLRAYDYSGADIVGKAAEFVYLEVSDTTVRRYAIGAESYSWTLAGGTLLCRRDLIDQVGGWAPVRFDVDRHLLEATRRAGGVGYRTHGFQYVLRRRGNGAGHTWQVHDRHFLDAAVERRPALDLRFADVVPAPIRSGIVSPSLARAPRIAAVA